MVNVVNLSTYIKKVLKEEDETIRITGNCISQMNSFLTVLGKKLAELSYDYSRKAKRKTIKKNFLKGAIESVISESTLRRDITKFADGAIEKYEKNSDKSHAQRAGLVFPPTKMRRFYDEYSSRVSELTDVYFASVMERIVREFLSDAIRATKDNKKSTINVRFLFLGVCSNEGSSKLLSKLNFKFSGSGVVPNIQSALMNKPAKSNPKKKPSGTDRKHRFRPGTVALREIKKYQKDSDVLYIPKLSFNRLVREILQDIVDEDTRMQKKAVLALQYYIEDYVTNIFKNSQLLAIHAGRVRIDSKDIHLLRHIEKQEVC